MKISYERRRRAQIVQTICLLALYLDRVQRQREREREEFLRWITPDWVKELLQPQAAIAFRSAANGGVNGTNSITVTLPAGTTTGDVTIICVKSSANTSTGPAGWTDIMNVAGAGWYVGYRVFQAGDGNPVVTTAGGSNFSADWGSATYSGIDTSNPIDGSSNFVGNASPVVVHSSGVQPLYNSGMLVCLFGSTNTGGAPTFTTPTGLTSRAARNGGFDTILIAEKALTDGSPTGDNSAPTNQNRQSLGCSVVLRKASATLATVVDQPPVLVGSTSVGGAMTAPITVDYSNMNPLQGDLALLFLNNSGAIAPTLSNSFAVLDHVGLGSNHDHLTIYRILPASPPTSFTINTGNTTVGSLIFYLIRLVGGTTTIENHGANGGAGLSTVNSPTFTPTSSSQDLLMLMWGQGSASSSATVSTPAGITADYHSGNQGSVADAVYAFVQLANKSTTTAYTSNLSSGTSALGALAVLVAGLGPPGSPYLTPLSSRRPRKYPNTTRTMAAPVNHGALSLPHLKRLIQPPTAKLGVRPEDIRAPQVRHQIVKSKPSLPTPRNRGALYELRRFIQPPAAKLGVKPRQRGILRSAVKIVPFKLKFLSHGAWLDKPWLTKLIQPPAAKLGLRPADIFRAKTDLNQLQYRTRLGYRFTRKVMRRFIVSLVEKIQPPAAKLGFRPEDLRRAVSNLQRLQYLKTVGGRFIRILPRHMPWLSIQWLREKILPPAAALGVPPRKFMRRAVKIVPFVRRIARHAPWLATQWLREKILPPPAKLGVPPRRFMRRPVKIVPFIQKFVRHTSWLQWLREKIQPPTEALGVPPRRFMRRPVKIVPFVQRVVRHMPWLNTQWLREKIQPPSAALGVPPRRFMRRPVKIVPFVQKFTRHAPWLSVQWLREKLTLPSGLPPRRFMRRAVKVVPFIQKVLKHTPWLSVQWLREKIQPPAAKLGIRPRRRTKIVTTVIQKATRPRRAPIRRLFQLPGVKLPTKKLVRKAQLKLAVRAARTRRRLFGSPAVAATTTPKLFRRAKLLRTRQSARSQTQRRRRWWSAPTVKLRMRRTVARVRAVAPRQPARRARRISSIPTSIPTGFKLRRPKLPTFLKLNSARAVLRRVQRLRISLPTGFKLTRPKLFKGRATEMSQVRPARTRRWTAAPRFKFRPRRPKLARALVSELPRYGQRLRTFSSAILPFVRRRPKLPKVLQPPRLIVRGFQRLVALFGFTSQGPTTPVLLLSMPLTPVVALQLELQSALRLTLPLSTAILVSMDEQVVLLMLPLTLTLELTLLLEEPS